MIRELTTLEDQKQNIPPAVAAMEKLLKESKFTRPDPTNPNKIERNGEKFTIERIENGQDPTLSKVQRRLEDYFGREEVDPEEIMRSAVDGKTPWGTPDITKYSINVVKDDKGEVIAFLAGGRVDLTDANNISTGKQVFVVGYAMTNIRHRTAVDEAYTAAITQAAREAQAEGKQLSCVVGETNLLAEAASNRVGIQLVYAADPEKPGSYKQVEYKQPALDFDPATGQVAEGAGVAREILAISSFGKKPLQKSDLNAIVRSIYTWCNTWPREAFESEEAWREHQKHVVDVWKDFKEQLEHVGDIVLFDKSTRLKLEQEARISTQEIRQMPEGKEAPTRFEALSRQRLDEAIALADRIFPDDTNQIEAASIAFPVSLEQEKYQEPMKEYDIRSVNYWMAIKEGRVVGLTGLYQKLSDPDNMAWIGWYGVAPEERGKGTGREILDWTITKAKADGIKKLRLYTSTAPEEAVAQKLYEEYGFRVYAEEPIPGSEHKMLYREKTFE